AGNAARRRDRRYVQRRFRRHPRKADRCAESPPVCVSQMKTFFGELFEYNHRMNHRLGEMLCNTPAGSLPNATRLFSHILDAHRIWNNRIDPRAADVGVWEILPPEKYAEINDANYAHTLRILENFELDESCAYRNSKGGEFKNAVKDIL